MGDSREWTGWGLQKVGEQLGGTLDNQAQEEEVRGLPIPTPYHSPPSWPGLGGVALRVDL